MIEGWYYLHKTGDLIYKREFDGSIAADIRESDFAVGLWPLDPDDREMAWDLLVEAWAAGANPQRIRELARRWKCDDDDAQHYIKIVGATLQKDRDAWCATRQDFINLQESPAGFGDTALEALGELCKELGYKPSKMWGPKFIDLLK